MIQEALFDTPPAPPKPVVCAEPLGPCCKCGADGTVRSPGGYIYCEKCGRCGARRVESTALGVEVKVCGKSVKQFVWNTNMGIWCCSCVA